MEAENSITLTLYDYGFHEYAYQDHEYIIRAMNTNHAQWIFLLPVIALCCSEHTCDQVA